MRCLAATLLFPTLCAAQNLIKNGDFEAAALLPWTVSGYAVNPGLTKYDTSGTGISRCYALHPGRSLSGPKPPFVLSQKGFTMAPIPYEITLDTAVFALPISISPVMPTVTIKIDTQAVHTQTYAFRGPNPKRARICVRFKPSSPGRKTLNIEVAYQGVARTSSPKVHIDNVDLRISRPPVFCFRGERRIGTSVQYEVTGSAGKGFVMFLAAKKLAAPVPLPGFTGKLAIDPRTAFPMLPGIFNAQGKFSGRLPVPPLSSLAGVPLYWQGVQATVPPALGWESTQGFYQ